jgi:condensin complex subunit 3
MDYQSLLENLLERVNDKEAPIRVQAVCALAKLQNPDELNDGSLANFEAEDDEDIEEDTPIKRLLRMLRYDPAA